MRTASTYRKQRGAALVVGLILLLVITVLAISGMNTATTELAMARNDQNYENAFQAAETGLETALAQGSFNTLATAAVTQYVSSPSYVTSKVTSLVEYEDSSLVPDKAFSLGVGAGIAAYHFLATSQVVSGTDPDNPAERDASALHTQAFYIVGPESPTL